jgi:hypothetical protein
MAAVLAAPLGGCGLDLGGDNDERLVDPELADTYRTERESTIGDLLAFNRPGGGPAGSALPVNKHLWRASLETLEFLPLESTDPFSGVIATDWATPEASPSERFKVTVYVSDPELRARSLRVAVHRQVRDDSGEWMSAEVNPATPRRLEDAILTKARQLRVAELEAEEG